MKLKLWQKVTAALAFAVGMAGVSPVFAADAPAAPLRTDVSPAVAKALADDAKCTKCHDESEQRPILAMYKTKHGVRADRRTPGCQSCHGASEAHVKNAAGASTRPVPDRMFVGPNASDAKVVVEMCISCHKAGKRTLWDGSAHESAGVACTSCHQVHVQGKDKVLDRMTQKEVCYTCHKTQRSEAMRISTHPIQAGKVICSDCHNPHGSQGPKLMADISIRDTCFTCHAEKRGPFLWDHPSAMDDCTNCHTPHGSNNAPLLKARAPFLCQNCHADGAPHPGNIYSGASLPGGAVPNANTLSAVKGTINPLTGQGVALNNPPPQLAFRSCLNCHTQVHGSNHPAGKRFTR